MIKTEAYFIDHCDDHSCDLGAFEFKCPSCKESFRDYDVWWSKDEVYDIGRHQFGCGSCKAHLEVTLDKEEMEYWVKEII